MIECIVNTHVIRHFAYIYSFLVNVIIMRLFRRYSSGIFGDETSISKDLEQI